MRGRLVIRRLRVLPSPGRQYSIMAIDHEILLTVFLCLQDSRHFLAKECAQYWLTAWIQKSVLRFTDRARHDPMGRLGRKTSTQTDR